MPRKDASKQLRRQASGAQHTHDDAGKLHGGSKLERLNNPSASGERSIAVTGDIHNSVFSTGDIHVHQHDTTRFERLEATVQSEASATRDEVRDGLTRIEQLLRQDQGNATEIELRTRIDVARELYQQGRFSIARTQATKLRESSDLPLKLQLQLSNIIGGSALHLGNPEAAVAELESALDQGPNDATILENAASANLLTGNFERARDLALRALQEKESTGAMATLLQATDRLEGAAAVQRLLNDHAWASKEPLTRVALAFTYLHNERHADAEVLLREDVPEVPRESFEAEHLALLAGIIIDQVQVEFAQTLPLPWALPERSRQRLHEAETLLSRVIDFWRDREPAGELGRALSNRAVALTLLGDLPAAMRDINAALALGYQDAQLLQNKVRLLLSKDLPDEAIALIASVPEEERSPGMNGLLGAAYLKVGQADAAIAALEVELTRVEGEWQRLITLELLLEAYLDTGDAENARRVKEVLERDGAERPGSIASIAKYYLRNGDTAMAHDLYHRALALPEATGQALVQLDYAALLANEGRFGEAADLYAPLVTPEADPQIAGNYAICLYNAGRYQEALAFAEAVREARGPQRVITEIEAHLRQVARDHQAAVPLWEALRKLQPDREEHRLALALAYASVGNYSAARTVLDRIRLDGLRSDPHLMMRYTQLRHTLAMQDVLEPAWEARRSDPNDAGLHAAFFVLFAERDHELAALEPGVVAADTTVTLERPGGETVSVTLLERQDVREGEISISSVLGRRLLGRRVGEEIVWRQTFFGTESAKVVKIRHKYVAVVQDIDPNRLPSDRPVLERLSGEPDELVQQLLARADQERAAEEAVLRDYERNALLPLHGLAWFRQHSLTHTKALLRSRADGVLHAFDGAPAFLVDSYGNPYQLGMEDLRRRAIRASTRVVLDDSALLTLAELELLDKLLERYEEVVVPQAVVNAFDNELQNQLRCLEPDGVPVWLEPVARARAWAREHARLAPVYARLAQATKRVEELDEVLGFSAVDALLIAQTEKVPVYTDDFGMSVLAAREWQVRPTNTRHLLDDLLERGNITLLEHARLLAKLKELRYSFVSFNRQHLIALFENEGLSGSLRQLIAGLAGPATWNSSAFQVGLGFIEHLLVTSSRPYQQRMTAIRWVLDALAAGRDHQQVAAVVMKTFKRAPEDKLIYFVMLERLLISWLARATEDQGGGTPVLPP